ncbi:MAG: hypothetical protein E5X67_23770 [Mesorhizobium sp.]|uniref:hypothetical protein n=1 Tax=Mesorhizobium sp. TaxID=1871066 RepID=UPI0011FC8E1B|nr:hypothetical protein [Mesorhizobium sp.]TIP25678.1 MAG: hypothetical protein E5X67_23770 [Mesorhizobium sp.]
MELVSPSQDFPNLGLLIWSERGLVVIGQALVVLSLFILAADIRRVHADIHNVKAGGIQSSEKRLRERMADKQLEMVKLLEVTRGRALPPVTHEQLQGEIGEIILWHQIQLDLTDAVRTYNSLDAKISTGKSSRAVANATGIAITGIALQVLSILIG